MVFHPKVQSPLEKSFLPASNTHPLVNIPFGQAQQFLNANTVHHLVAHQYSNCWLLDNFTTFHNCTLEFILYASAFTLHCWSESSTSQVQLFMCRMQCQLTKALLSSLVLHLAHVKFNIKRAHENPAWQRSIWYFLHFIDEERSN